MRLDAVGPPAPATNSWYHPLMPAAPLACQRPHEQVITVADCKNLPKRLDDQVEEGKAGSVASSKAPAEVNEAYQQVAFADKDPKSLNRRNHFSQTKVWLCKTSELGCPDHPEQAGSRRLRRSYQSEGHFFFFSFFFSFFFFFFLFRQM